VFGVGGDGDDPLGRDHGGHRRREDGQTQTTCTLRRRFCCAEPARAKWTTSWLIF
jgi:hypothetical protein